MAVTFGTHPPHCVCAYILHFTFITFGISGVIIQQQKVKLFILAPTNWLYAITGGDL